MQSDLLEDWSTVVLLMFTTEKHHSPISRPRFVPDDHNGLERPCDLMADLPTTVRKEKIGRVIGRLSPADLAIAERALLVVLGFGRP